MTIELEIHFAKYVFHNDGTVLYLPLNRAVKILLQA